MIFNNRGIEHPSKARRHQTAFERNGITLAIKTESGKPAISAMKSPPIISRLYAANFGDAWANCQVPVCLSGSFEAKDRKIASSIHGNYHPHKSVHNFLKTKFGRSHFALSGMC